jgi:hypothetical protein
MVMVASKFSKIGGKAHGDTQGISEQVVWIVCRWKKLTRSGTDNQKKEKNEKVSIHQHPKFRKIKKGNPK